jgi:catechol 2,3-dioxygenase-like lactoylglutathione lyase family enzyme
MRLHHVGIPVPPGSLDAGAAFFADAFGLQEIDPPESLGRERVRWFALADRELHLFTEPDADATTSRRHLALAVDDLERVRAHLTERRIALQEDTPIHNRPRFLCSDPFGNRIEVTQIVGPYR